MAKNTSILAAFERMWLHVVAALGNKSDVSHNHDDEYYTIEQIDTKVSEINTTIDNKANAEHNHDDLYYTEAEVDTQVSNINTSITNIVNGTTKVGRATQADTAASAETASTADSATKAEQDASGNVITSTYETKTDASAKLTEAKTYTDTVTATKSDSTHNHDSAYDTKGSAAEVQVAVDSLKDSVAYIDLLDNETVEVENATAASTVVDSALSASSTNPVQNKVITSKINQIQRQIEDSNKRIDNIEQGLESVVPCEVDASIAYAKDVPSNALPYADVSMIGGATYMVDSSAVSVPVTAIESIGANMIPSPYSATSHTENGITWTADADGSVTANGTATGLSRFVLSSGDISVYKNKSIMLTGCPAVETSGEELNSPSYLRRWTKTYEIGDTPLILNIKHKCDGSENYDGVVAMFLSAPVSAGRANYNTLPVRLSSFYGSIRGDSYINEIDGGVLTNASATFTNTLADNTTFGVPWDVYRAAMRDCDIVATFAKTADGFSLTYDVCAVNGTKFVYTATVSCDITGGLYVLFTGDRINATIIPLEEVPVERNYRSNNGEQLICDGYHNNWTNSYKITEEPLVLDIKHTCAGNQSWEGIVALFTSTPIIRGDSNNNYIRPRDRDGFLGAIRGDSYVNIGDGGVLGSDNTTLSNTLTDPNGSEYINAMKDCNIVATFIKATDGFNFTYDVSGANGTNFTYRGTVDYAVSGDLYVSFTGEQCDCVVTPQIKGYGIQLSDIYRDILLCTDIGEGGVYRSLENKEIQAFCYVSEGETVSNLTFKPMLHRGVQPLPYSAYYYDTVDIPEAIQNLDGYGEGNPNNPEECNAILYADGKWIYRRRGGITNDRWVALSNTIDTDISHLISDDGFIEVEGNGTVVFANSHRYDVPSEITYQLKEI